MLAIGLAGCAAATASSPPTDVSITTANPVLPANAYVIAQRAAQRLLGQCSRPGPASAAPFSRPADADIALLETRLAQALASASATEGIQSAQRFVSDRSAYVRQYTGYRADGRAMIYGNFLPASDFADSALLAEEAMIVCDGGAAFFGVEYDVAAQTITRIAFNGSKGGPQVPAMEY